MKYICNISPVDELHGTFCVEYNKIIWVWAGILVYLLDKTRKMVP